MESLEQFFRDNQRGYSRDPRRVAYAKLQKNTQGMDREQLEAFITANLFIPHSQYKMALGNLIQFLKKQDQMSKLNEVKQFQKVAGLLKETWHPDKEWDETDDEEEDYDTGIPSDEELFGLSEEESGNAAHVVREVQKLVDGLLEKGRIGPKQAKMVMNYVKKHGETLSSKLETPMQWFNAAADTTWKSRGHRLGTKISEDDYSEDPSSNMDDESQSGDTDAMGIDEAGNIKGIKIEIPGNSYASDFGKAAAREVVESFGPREYRNFLEAFLNEFKKITGGV
jgi:hypothetical protein